jgi:hypothetical protein
LSPTTITAAARAGSLLGSDLELDEFEPNVMKVLEKLCIVFWRGSSYSRAFLSLGKTMLGIFSDRSRGLL